MHNFAINQEWHLFRRFGGEDESFCAIFPPGCLPHEKQAQAAQDREEREAFTYGNWIICFNKTKLSPARLFRNVFCSSLLLGESLFPPTTNALPRLFFFRSPLI